MPDNNLNLTNTQYLDALIPAPKPGQQQLLLNAVISLDNLKLYSLSDQIQTILRDGKVINFDLLLRMLDNAAWSADLVLQTLPSVGMLVQGNWTVLSEILYPTGTLSGTNGVPAELMCRARDYVVRPLAHVHFATVITPIFVVQLFKLSRNEPLERPRVAIVTQIPPDEVHEIMLTVAQYTKGAGWQLLLPPDHQFEQNYQRYKERQDLYWRAKEQKFHEMETADHESTAATSSATVTTPPKRRRTKSTRSDGGGGGHSVKQEK